MQALRLGQGQNMRGDRDGGMLLVALLLLLLIPGCGRSRSSSVVSGESRTSIFATKVTPRQAVADSTAVSPDSAAVIVDSVPVPSSPEFTPLPPDPSQADLSVPPGEVRDAATDSITWSPLPVPPPKFRSPEDSLLAGADADAAGQATGAGVSADPSATARAGSGDSLDVGALPDADSVATTQSGVWPDSVRHTIPGAAPPSAAPSSVATGTPETAAIDSLSGRVTDSLATAPPVDELADFTIPDEVRGEVHLDTPVEKFETRAPYGLWSFEKRLDPASEALLYSVSSRVRNREIMLRGNFLRPEEKTRIDSLELRLLPPDAPKLTAPAFLAPQIAVDLETETVLLTDLFLETPVAPPVRMSMDEYARRLMRIKARELWAEEALRGISQAKSTTPSGLLDLDIPIELPRAMQSIFGSGEPKLKVSGSERITFAGTSRWRPYQVQDELGRKQSKFPQLEMEQELNLKLSGTIGDKVQIDVDQSSQSTTPLANRIQIHYDGYDDEIIQRVDLGNTSLRLPGTRYVTYNGRAEGLFGINTLAKLGDVDLNMVLSKQEGQNDSKSVSRRSETRSVQVFDWQYIQRKYFFLRDPDGCPWEIDPTTLEVYVDDLDGRNNTQDAAVSGIVTGDGTEDFPGRQDAFRDGKWNLLIGSIDYTVLTNPYPGMPILELSRPVDNNHYLAVTYEGWELVPDGTTGGLVRGQRFRVGHRITVEEPFLRLKMLRVSRSNPAIDQENLRAGPWGPIARLEMRNVYDLGARNILADGFDLRIRLRESSANTEDPDRIGDNGPTFLQMTGIDLSVRTTAGVAPGHDNVVDQGFLNTQTGTLFLPDLRPFDPDSSDLALDPAFCNGYTYSRFRPGGPGALTEARPESLGTSTWLVIDPGRYRAPEIYDRAVLNPSPDVYSRYYLDATYRSPVSTIQLDAFNILPGSERVTASGRTLTRDRDYRIDYEIGEVEILDAANVTESDQIDVTYQFVPFGGGGGQKTLAGISAFVRPEESKWNVSSTWFFESKGGVPGVEGRRPRLGEEPSRTLVGEFAGQYRTDSWLMTDLVDRLPFLNARQPSRLEIDAGVGISLPNPNTRNVLYIDDFEGAKDVLDLSMSRRSWTFTAIPLLVLQEEGFDSLAAATRKGELLWYSPRQALQQWDLQPTLEEREGDDNRQMLEIYMATKGTTPQERRKSWVGLTQPLSVRGVDLSQAQFLDVWINDGIPYEQRHLREGKLYIDLGSVSEDAMWHRNDLFADPSTWVVVPPNGRLDSEDVNEDGILDQSNTRDEDTGMDRLSNAQGDTSFDDYAFEDSNTDDEVYQPYQFRRINGTEGNQYLDTEDLNGDLVPQRSNSYFEIEIDLADSTLWETDVRRDFVLRDPGEPLTETPADTSGWRRIRIPLSDELLVRIMKDGGVSDPDWERIFHSRIWFTGISRERQRLQLGGIEIIGNRWFERPLSDMRDRELPREALAPGEEFFVGVLNNKDDKAVYVPPFTPRNLPQDNVQEREQSITLELRNFQPGHRAAIYRIYPREQNFSSLYNTLEFYLNKRFISGDANLVMSIRLGKDAAPDTTNYYEYTRPLPDGWDLVQIDLAELSRLQLETPDSTSNVVRKVLPDGAVITRKGSPSLNLIRRVTFTVTNVGGTPLREGNIWIDELRLSGVKKETGTAQRVQVNAKFSDFMDITGNFEKSGADFVSIGQNQGSGTTSTTTNLSSRIALQKFVERSGISLPLTLSFNRTRLVPKFKTGSDLVVDQPTDRDISERQDQQFLLSYSKRRSENPWLRYLVDPFSGSVSQGRSINLTPTRRDTTVTRTGTVNWQLSLDQVGLLRVPTDGVAGLFKRPEIQLLPTRLSASLTGRTTDSKVYRRTDLSKPYEREETFTPSSTDLSLGMGFNPVRSIRYDIDSARDLNLRRNQQSLMGIRLGRERSRSQGLNANWDIPLFTNLLSPRVSWDGKSNLTFLQQGGQSAVENEPDRYNDYRNSSTTTFQGRLSVDELGRFIRDFPPGGKDSTRVESRGGGRSSFRLQPINMQYSISTSTTYSRRRGEPSLAFQLGLSRDLGGQSRALSNSVRTASDSKGFGWDTSVELPFSMSVKPRFNHQVTDTDANGVTSVTRETSWPELDVQWGNLYQRLKLDKLLHLKSFSANTRYSRKTSEQGPRGAPLITRTTTTGISPLVSIRASMENGISATLNSSRNESITERFQPPSLTRTETSSATLDLKKSIELRKRVKVPGSSSLKVINTRMDVNAGIDWRKSATESRAQGGASTESGNVQLAITTGSTYQFTDRITGAANVRVGQDSNTKEKSKTTRFVTISVSASFNF